MANGTAAYAQLVARWERAAKAAEPGHGETFDSVLSQSVAVVSQLKKGVYAPRQGERVSETRLQAAGASQTAYDNMHSAGVDILDWEPSPHPDGSGPSPSRATSMRRGELARTNTRNALLAAVAIFTPRSATASPRSRNLTSDNGKGTSFRSSGMLAASGVAPPPAGAGQGGKAAAGASPARGSATRIGKLEQQQQDGASPRPRPPGGAASGEATTPRRVRLSLAQVPAGDGEEGDEEGLGAGFGSEAGGGSCAPTFRSKASSRPSFNRVSNNGTNRVSFNGTNRLSYNGSIRGSFNGARSCASSVYGGPDRDSGDSNYEYDSYDDDGVDTDACSHVSRAASRNSRTSARSRATTNSLGAFSDFDVDDDGSWTPHQGGAMISPAVLRGRSKAKARAMSRADEAIIELALNAYEPGEARHSLMVPPGGLGGAAGAGAEAGAASGASQLFDRRKLRVAVPPGEVPLAPVPRAVPAHVAHGLHAPTQVVLAAAEHGLLGPEQSMRPTSFTSGAPSPLASPGACRDVSPSMAANPYAQRSRLADAAPNNLRHSWAPSTAGPDSSPPSPGNNHSYSPGGIRLLKSRGGQSFAPSQAATTATAARAQARAQLPELPSPVPHSGGPGGVHGSGGSFTAKRASLAHSGGQPGGGGGGGEHGHAVGSHEGAAGPGCPGVRSGGSVLLPRNQGPRMAAPAEGTAGLHSSCPQLPSPDAHSPGTGTGSCHPEAASWPHSPGHGGLPSPGGAPRHAAGSYSMGCPLRPGAAAAVSPVRGRASGGGGGGGGVAGSSGSFMAHALPYTDGVQHSGGSGTSAAGGLIRGYAGAGHGLDYRNFDAVPRLGFDTARIRPQQHGNMGGGAAAATAHARHSGEQALPVAGPDLLRRSLAAAPAGLAAARTVARPGTAADGPSGAAGSRQGQGSGAEVSPGRFARARRQSCADAGMLMGPQASGPSGMLLTREQVDKGLRAHGGAGAGAGGEGGRRQVVLSVIGKRGSVSGPPGGGGA